MAHTKFYAEDLVKHKKTMDEYLIVLRCWHDAEDYPPDPNDPDPVLRPLTRGQFGAAKVTDGQRLVQHERDYTLIDRTFQPGDLCKSSLDDVKSGVVLNVEVEGRLSHAISRRDVPGWKALDDIKDAIDVDVGDYVTVDDWIGTIEEIYDEVIVEMGNGALYKMCDIALAFHVGDRPTDLVPNTIRSALSAVIGLLRERPDMVVKITHRVLAVAWTAINQSLPPAETESRSRPQTYWYGEDISKLTLVRARAEQSLHVGAKVLLKDPPAGYTTTHGKVGDPLGPIEVETFVVKETRTTVRVLWQDGTEGTVRATDLIPHLNPDEYDCWPGDHVIWKGEDESRVAVVQTMDAQERIASVRFIDRDDSTIQDVSVLELDLHGVGEWGSSVAPESLGVRRGDFVFIRPPGLTNGASKFMVPRIGEIEPWVREPSDNHSGRFSGWRGIMQDFGHSLYKDNNPQAQSHGMVQRPGSSFMNWFGEVVGLRLDGTVDVSLPGQNAIQNLPIQRLTKLYEGGEQIEDAFDEMSEDGDSYISEVEGGQVEIQREDGQWELHDHFEDDGDEWEDEDEESTPMDIDSRPAEEVPPRGRDAQQDLVSSQAHIQLPPIAAMESINTTAEATTSTAPDRDKSQWKRFDILPEAPHDHAFYSSSTGQRSRQFFSRMSKEYRALESGLPESILVRAYEDRGDLLRSLILGPENTPYEDAPFVIDWHLNEDFPHSPPTAHFWSWTNGNGRVNPNLYEEGKVCLSILGTWAGDQSESWSAARSSLLQAFVSIQGLVLVKEPWFCEPAYDKLRGTEEGVVNSRLYNEKAFILSRGFVRRALDIPVGTLEGEIQWMYHTNGKLAKIVQNCRALIERSKQPSTGHGDSDAAVPRLTAGGVLTLSRTLARLESLMGSP